MYISIAAAAAAIGSAVTKKTDMPKVENTSQDSYSLIFFMFPNMRCTKFSQSLQDNSPAPVVLVSNQWQCRD
ncbi:hypothetical protein B723_28585 [Pseudomonas fluorescens NCIMB 11764]|uniref:Uncharacterized protein n=1 Tax=Pseudomonas fluorescens NCIMB 11764 TaxID=1221522 RepID=A0A0K1QWU4_PSEFL|nr:hypothetical protein [Pseudomonas fluorescens]AKV10142.1 hypothetical protein B723_28585 [Pseudomonas fluorescens NCIMB 11764]